MTPPQRPIPNATVNQTVRIGSAVASVLNALLLLGGMCTFFTRGTLANLLLMTVAFIGTSLGWKGYRQLPVMTQHMFFGRLVLGGNSPTLLVEPAYGAISIVILIIGLCAF